MELKEIAVVSGKPGLFKIVKPAVNGVILEALDGTSARFIAGSSTKVSVLAEISVYTQNGDNIALEEVFRTIFTKHGKSVQVGSKSNDKELRDFFTDLLPEHDNQRVYTSDIKKIAVWYSLLIDKGLAEKFATKTTDSTEIKSKKGATKSIEETSESVKKEKPKPPTSEKEKPTAEEKKTAKTSTKKTSK
jgi:hypothetical protein